MNQEQQEQQNQQQELQQLNSKILIALTELSKTAQDGFDIEAHAIAGSGENAYGLIQQVQLKSKIEGTILPGISNCILKIAPKNSARRSHMKVADYYAREVYMYRVVFNEYRSLIAESTQKASVELDFIPKMLHYSLDESDEFIIFEDLTQSGYKAGKRTQLPNLEMATMALRGLGNLHGLSFALQAKKPEIFKTIIENLQPDNLFTENIDPISIEFGKSYIKRARNMIESEELQNQNNERQLRVLDNVENNFKEICLRCVNGKKCDPFVVICHGDFWNNNILNKYDDTNGIVSAKLIDFQMSRYASPVLDLVHYLFVCTAPELRDDHFYHLLHNVYYGALEQQLHVFNLKVSSIYPREIFDDHLRNYGVYGLCMAAFSLPFFVADTTELFDLDEVSEAVKDIESKNTESAKSSTQSKEEDLKESRLKLIEDFSLLTERTSPIFKYRMVGIVADIIKYEMITEVDL